MNKRIVSLNKKASKDVRKLEKLVEFLTIVDKDLPYEDFLKHSGLELFPILFKLTFYEKENSVFNHSLSEGAFSLSILPAD